MHSQGLWDTIALLSVNTIRQALSNVNASLEYRARHVVPEQSRADQAKLQRAQGSIDSVLKVAEKHCTERERVFQPVPRWMANLRNQRLLLADEQFEDPELPKRGVTRRLDSRDVLDTFKSRLLTHETRQSSRALHQYLAYLDELNARNEVHRRLTHQVAAAEQSLTRSRTDKLALRLKFRELDNDLRAYANSDRRDDIEKAQKLRMVQAKWLENQARLTKQIEDAKADLQTFRMGDSASKILEPEIAEMERQVQAVMRSYHAQTAEFETDLRSIDGLHEVVIEGLKAELQNIRAKALDQERNLTRDALNNARAEQERRLGKLKKDLDGLGREFRRVLQRPDPQIGLNGLSVFENSRLKIMKEVMAVEKAEAQEFMKEHVQNLEIDFETRMRQIRLEREGRRNVFSVKRSRLNDRIDDRNFEMEILNAQFATDSGVFVDVAAILDTMKDKEPNSPRVVQNRAIRAFITDANAFIRKANFVISELLKRLWMAGEEAKFRVARKERLPKSNSLGNLRRGFDVATLATDLEEEEIAEEEEITEEEVEEDGVVTRKKVIKWTKIKRRPHLFGPKSRSHLRRRKPRANVSEPVIARRKRPVQSVSASSSLIETPSQSHLLLQKPSAPRLISPKPPNLSGRSSKPGKVSGDSSKPRTGSEVPSKPQSPSATSQLASDQLSGTTRKSRGSEVDPIAELRQYERSHREGSQPHLRPQAIPEAGFGVQQGGSFPYDDSHLDELAHAPRLYRGGMQSTSADRKYDPANDFVDASGVVRHVHTRRHVRATDDEYEYEECEPEGPGGRSSQSCLGETPPVDGRAGRSRSRSLLGPAHLVTQRRLWVDAGRQRHFEPLLMLAKPLELSHTRPTRKPSPPQVSHQIFTLEDPQGFVIPPPVEHLEMIQATRREPPVEGRQCKSTRSARAAGRMAPELTLFPEKGPHRPNFASEPRGYDAWAEWNRFRGEKSFRQRRNAKLLTTGRSIQKTGMDSSRRT